MSEFQRTGTERSHGADPAVTALLRAAYAAPTDENYWQSFEQRVMTRLNESTPVAWWAVFGEWRQAGLVAATVAMMLAGAAMVREQQLAESVRQMAAGAAYYTIFEDATGDVSVAFSVPLSEKAPVEAPERYLDTFYP